MESSAEGEAHSVHIEIDDGRGVEGEHLAEDQAADDGDAEGFAEFGAHAVTECEGEAAEERGHCRHHDRAEAEEAGFEDGVLRRDAFAAFYF